MLQYGWKFYRRRGVDVTQNIPEIACALHAFVCPSGLREDAYRLLRFAFRRVYGAPMPAVEKHPTGKPYFPDRPDVFFSLSHTKTHSMVVIGAAICGCDVETHRTVSPRLPARVCTEAELAEFDFLECWVLKESLIKISGRPPQDLRELEFSRADGNILGPTGERAKLYPLDGAFAAVCCVNAEPPASLIAVSPEELSGGDILA